MTEKPPLPPKSAVELPRSVRFDMESKAAGSTYRIFVFEPHMPAPPEGYPVLVASDGNINFPLAMAMATMFGFSAAPALVVCVGYPTDNPLEWQSLRTRDLTPKTPIEAIRPMPGLPPPAEENFGGAEAFHRFLTEELRPAIAAAWPVDPANETLYGYSLGGLFTLHALFAHPASYRTFVAGSPSIWWNDRAVLAGEAGFSTKVAAGEVAPRVLVTIGELEQDPPKTTPPGMTETEAAALIASAAMVDNARQLGERLARVKGAPGYEAKFHLFHGEDHLSAMAAAIARALDFALRR
ncbi:MAG: alpha/beta hydrolase [Caulobacteraceae bacterium]